MDSPSPRLPEGGATKGVGIETQFRSLCDSTGVASVAREIGWMDKSGEIKQLKKYDSASKNIKHERERPAVNEKKRKKCSYDDDESSDESSGGGGRKPAKSAKTNKGLRHFSKKVCEKVEQKGKTTYNEVADELVNELTQGTSPSSVDSKNIRRRVYDALNVLMAMNIIEKDKKDIQWRGLPQTSDKDSRDLEQEYKERQECVEKKREQLAELDSQRTLYSKLITLNQGREATDSSERLFLPFIIVQTKKETIINCEMSPDRDEYFFDFSQPFSIYDDNEILNHIDLTTPMETATLPTFTPHGAHPPFSL